MRSCFAIGVFLAALASVAVPPAGAGQLDREIAFWESHLERDPYDYVSRIKLGTAYLRKARVGGDYRQTLRAESVLREALARAPQSYDGLVALAFALNAQHRFEDGARVARQAVELRPQALLGYGALGDALLERGDVAGAQLAYDKLIALDGGLFALTRRANLRFIRGDTRGALEDVRQAAEIGRARGAAAEDIARCYVTIGAKHFLRGAFDEAEAHYREALKLWPDGYLPLEHLAELRAARGDFEGALALYERVVSKVPNPDLLQAVGDVHAARFDGAAAARWHDRALAGYLARVADGDRSYYRNLALFFADIRPDPAQSLEWARKDLVVRQNVYTYDTLAWALYRNGMFDEALDAANHALKHETEDATLWLHAAKIHQALDQEQKARRHLQRALLITPARTLYGLNPWLR